MCPEVYAFCSRTACNKVASFVRGSTKVNLAAKNEDMYQSCENARQSDCKCKSSWYLKLTLHCLFQGRLSLLFSDRTFLSISYFPQCKNACLRTNLRNVN